MVWDISPVAFTVSLFGMRWSIHWYGMLFAATFVWGILIFRYIYRQEGRDPEQVYDLVLWVIAGTVVGARLGHVLFYDPGHYFPHPWEILKVWEGGLASHGAALGILAGVWLYSRSRPDQGFLWICDRIGMAVPLSGCLIRIGNFFNSEILGTPTDVPWAVVFARMDPLPRHPVQLYEAFCYLLIFLAQWRFYRRHKSASPAGYLFGRFFVFAFSARFLLEFYKEQQAAFETGWALSMGQWLSIPAVIFGLYLMWRSHNVPANETAVRKPT